MMQSAFFIYGFLLIITRPGTCHSVSGFLCCLWPDGQHSTQAPVWIEQGRGVWILVYKINHGPALCLCIGARINVYIDTDPDICMHCDSRRPCSVDVFTAAATRAGQAQELVHLIRGTALQSYTERPARTSTGNRLNQTDNQSEMRNKPIHFVLCLFFFCFCLSSILFLLLIVLCSLSI